MKRITVCMIRHPLTEGNVLSNSEATGLPRPNHLFQPTPKGDWQMEMALKAYQEKGFRKPTAIYCSTFLRTRVLAEKFSNRFGVKIFEDSRLNEKWDGIFHSLSAEEIKERYPDQIRLRNKYGWYHYSSIGGENGPAVELRERSFFQDIADNKKLCGKTILLAVHGNWLHLFEKWALGLKWQEIEERRKIHPIHPCSISVYWFYPPSFFEKVLDRYAPWNTEESAQYA